MKKRTIFSILLCAAVLVVGLLCSFTMQSDSGAAFSPECEKLSELSDAGILEFIEYYEIDVPDGYVESDEELAQLVRQWIKAVEEDPSHNPVRILNFKPTYTFGTAVFQATQKHYGWDFAT